MSAVFVVYDISMDSRRTSFSRRLVYYGLERVQYSVFFGVLPSREVSELSNWIKEYSLGENDVVHIITLCDRCYDKIIVHGEETQPVEHLIL